MSKAFSVFVNIGGKLNPSLAAAVSGAKREFRGLEAVTARIASRINAPFEAVNKHLAETNKRMASLRRHGRNATLGITAPLGFGASALVRRARERNIAGNDLEANGGVSHSERLRAEAYADSIAPLYGATTNLLHTTTELVKAGFNFNAALGALPAVAEGAAIAGDALSMAQVGENTMKAIAQFNLASSTMEQAAGSSKRVVDLMAYGANASVASFKDFSEGMKWVGPLAHSLGATVEDVTGMLLTLARKGIVGSEAGVTLRSDFLHVVKPTKQGLATEKRLGIDRSNYVTEGHLTGAGASRSLSAMGYDVGAKFLDGLIAKHKGDPLGLQNAVADHLIKRRGATGETDKKTIRDAVTEGLVASGTKVDLPGYFKTLRDHGATPADYASIFEGRHVSRNQVLGNGDIGGDIADVTSNAPDYSHKAFGVKNQGLDAMMKRLEAAWSMFGNTLTESVMPQLLSVMEGAANLVKNLSSANPALLRMGIGLTAAAAAAGPLMFVLGSVGRLGTLALTGLLTPIAMVANGIVGLGAAMAGGLVAGVARLRGMVVGLRMLTALGAGATLSALGGSLLAMGRAVMMFPVTALRGIAMAMWALVANPVGLIIGGLVLALAALGIWVANNWNGIKSFFAGFGAGFMENLGPAGGAIKTMADGLQSAFNWLTKLLGPLDASKESWAAWGASLGSAAANGVSVVISGISKLIGFLGAVVEKAISAGNAIKGMFGFGGGAKPAVPAAPLAGARALGGPVSFGRPYLVGERGPELFVPGAGGRIETNDTLRRLTADGAAAVADLSSTTTTSRGPVTFSPTFNISGENPQAVAAQIDNRMRRFLAELESEQRGYLSD